MPPGVEEAYEQPMHFLHSLLYCNAEVLDIEVDRVSHGAVGVLPAAVWKHMGIHDKGRRACGAALRNMTGVIQGRGDDLRRVMFVISFKICRRLSPERPW